MAGPISPLREPSPLRIPSKVINRKPNLAKTDHNFVKNLRMISKFELELFYDA